LRRKTGHTPGRRGYSAHPARHWDGREKVGDPRPPVEQASVERDLEVIHSDLNDSDFARLSAEGQSMTVDEAVALALDE